MKPATASRVLILGLVLLLSPALRAEVTVTVTQRKTASSLTFEETTRKVANLWLTLVAPAGMHFETFEVTAVARDGKPSDPESLIFDLKLTEGERKVRAVAWINDYGAHRENGAMPTLRLRGYRGDTVSRDRARFVCLVRDDVPLVLQAGEQALPLPPATPGPLSLPKLEFALKVLEQHVVESVLIDDRHGPDVHDRMESEFFLPGKKLRRVTVACTVKMDADLFRGMSVSVDNDHIALVDKTGRYHHPLGGIVRTGIVSQTSINRSSLMIRAQTDGGESTGEKELIFIDDPALDEARLVFVPSALNHSE